ncbi:MAG: hypothetical protein A2408_00610 [Candidatus Yonathbacteria bacterium RIFOXYC1_FULL_52_10]|nr:MAG: hypothetical protein A2408_00610 [Candidatus Yonathbacteria bacterium RIFOXYC1_FULL_52_10]
MTKTKKYVMNFYARGIGHRAISFLMLFSVVGMSFAPVIAPTPKADAAVTGWHKGASIVARSSTDYASESFKASLRDLKATGATHVGLVATYYQTSITSSDIYRTGTGTPTDASLAEAIRYARSIGLQVTVKVHAEPLTHDWRGRINPNDKAAWFQTYGDLLVRIATLAQTNGAENFSIGTEMVTLANKNNGQTDRWVALINRVRGVYSGNVTYEANSSYPDPNDWISNEKAYVGFWPSVDFISISAYFSLPGDSQNSVASFVSAWDQLNDTHLQPFYNQYNKPIIFSEVGYRSVNGANMKPYESWTDAPYNAELQARLYEALLSYWGTSSYMRGVYLWNWISYPDAGGTGNKDYTPQNKPAEEVMRQWFGTINGETPPPPPPEPQTATFSAALVAAGTLTAGQRATLGVSAQSDTAVSNAIIDYEIYDGQGRKVFQRYFSGQNFAAGETKQYSLDWTPASNGSYTLKMGAFASNWSRLYTWRNNVATLSVGPAATPGTITIVAPTNGATLSDTQTFKASLGGYTLPQYTMYWKVDGGTLNAMRDSADSLNKEALVSVRNWKWRSSGEYTVTFVAKDLSGVTLRTASVKIRAN